MKNNIKKHWVGISLTIILLAACALRLLQLGTIPSSPDWDEASLGYNAYSILKTGKDEYSEPFPFVLRSFDDYKPALYTYLIIPLIPVIGLSDFTVRLPSALFGVLAVFGTYLLAKELFSSLFFGKKNGAYILGLVSALMLSIMPWHIQFSRIAFESQVGMCFNIFVFYFFLKGLKNPKFLLLSFALAALNIHMYQSNRVFSPLLVIVLSLIYFKAVVVKYKKWFILSIIIACIISLPFVYYSFTNSNALLRAKGVSIFSDQKAIERSVQKLSVDSSQGNIIGQVLNNRRVEYVKLVAAGYISHLHLNWLFTSGDIARHHAPFMGLLYLFEIITIPMGIYILLFSSYDKQKKIVFFMYLLLVPIPASITSGVPHAVRTLNFAPLIAMVSAAGILTIYFWLSKLKMSIGGFKIKYVIFVLLLALISFNILYYLNQYFVQQNFYTSKDWQYGYKEAVSEVQKVQDKYNRIVVSNRPHLDQSYIFFLYYLRYDPLSYQNDAKNASGGFRENHSFGKFEFRPIDWVSETRGNTLFVGRPEDIGSSAKILKEIHFLNGEKAIVIAE